MTPPQFLPLLSTVFVFGLGVFVLLKDIRSKTNILFGLFCLGTTVWLFGTFMMFRSQTNAAAIFWDRVIYIGGILNPILLYHFGRAFLDKKKKRGVLWLGYILALFFLIISRTDYFAADLYKYSWGVHTQARLFHHPFLVYFVGFMILFLVDVLGGMKHATGVKKAQIKYIFLALLAMAVVGTPAFLPAYGIDIYPFAYLSGAIFAGIVAYAITCHRLLGITVILRKTTVYLATFLVTISLFLVSLLSLPKMLKFEIPWQAIPSGILSMCVAALVFPALLNLFESMANKYFFASLYQSEKVLNELKKEVLTIINLPQLLDLVCKTLKDCFHLRRVGVLLYDPKTSKYQALLAEGFRPQNGLTLVRNNFLTQYLTENKRPLVYQELKPILDTIQKTQKSKIAAIKKLSFHMKKIEASVCCPLISKNRLIGVLLLGPKVSKEPYFREDIEFLENLSYQVSVGLENARLYSEMKDFSAKLEAEVKERTKELKKAYDKLKELDKMKDEFISITSHELRTPMTAVQGYLWMLQKKGGELNAKQKKYLERAQGGSERMIRLINDMLDVSRIEQERVELEIRTVELTPIIEEVVDELKIKAKKKKLKLEFLAGDRPLPPVKADAGKVRRILTNLLDNALKFTEEGGVTIEGYKKGRFVQVNVTDTGRGISKEDLPRLFKKFGRLESDFVTAAEAGGTGLGLYISRALVERMRGKISVQSTPKKGSTFSFTLPVSDLPNKFTAVYV